MFEISTSFESLRTQTDVMYLCVSRGVQKRKNTKGTNTDVPRSVHPRHFHFPYQLCPSCAALVPPANVSEGICWLSCSSVPLQPNADTFQQLQAAFRGSERERKLLMSCQELSSSASSNYHKQCSTCARGRVLLVSAVGVRGMYNKGLGDKLCSSKVA